MFVTTRLFSLTQQDFSRFFHPIHFQTQLFATGMVVCAYKLANQVRHRKLQSAPGTAWKYTSRAILQMLWRPIRKSVEVKQTAS